MDLSFPIPRRLPKALRKDSLDSNYTTATFTCLTDLYDVIKDVLVHCGRPTVADLGLC
jgi:hypothetical protein